jgi:hypothetical protein
MSTVKMVIALKAKCPKEITADRADIIDIGLMRIASQVASRRAKSNSDVNLALFEEFDVQPLIFVTVATENGLTRVAKKLGDVTYQEAERHAGEVRRPVVRGNANKEFVRLTEAMKASGAKPIETIVEWWAAKKATPKP